jgi:hypothetical protein
MDAAWIRTVTYDASGAGERRIDVDPNEADMVATQQAQHQAQAPRGEREYVE